MTPPTEHPGIIARLKAKVTAIKAEAWMSGRPSSPDNWKFPDGRESGHWFHFAWWPVRLWRFEDPYWHPTNRFTWLRLVRKCRTIWQRTYHYEP